MGLESVEFIMALEEKYGLEIPDRDAESFQTPAQLIDYIMARLAMVDEASCPSQWAFYRLRRALLTCASVPRSSIRPDTRWNELLPSARWRSLWTQLGTHVGLPLPRLVRPAWFWWLTVLIFLIASVPLSATLGSMAAVVVLAGLFAVLIILTARLGTVPASFATIGDIAVYLSRHAPATPPASSLTREAVKQEVHRLMVEVLGVEDPFTDESRFVDLL